MTTTPPEVEPQPAVDPETALEDLEELLFAPVSIESPDALAEGQRLLVAYDSELPSRTFSVHRHLTELEAAVLGQHGPVPMVRLPTWDEVAERIRAEKV